MSTFIRQPSQTDRISAPSGLPQPEPYLASEDISRTERHRSRRRSRRRRSRSRPGRRTLLWDDESDSSIDLGRWPRAQARHRSRSKENFPFASDMLESDRMLRAVTQIASDMTPVVEREVERYPQPYPGFERERDKKEPEKERDRQRGRRTRSHRYYSPEDSDSDWERRRRHVSRRRTPTKAPNDPPKGNQQEYQATKPKQHAIC